MCLPSKGLLLKWLFCNCNPAPFQNWFNGSPLGPVPDWKSIETWVTVTTFRQTVSVARRRTGVPSANHITREYRGSDRALNHAISTQCSLHTKMHMPLDLPIDQRSDFFTMIFITTLSSWQLCKNSLNAILILGRTKKRR